MSATLEAIRARIRAKNATAPAKTKAAKRGKAKGKAQPKAQAAKEKVSAAVMAAVDREEPTPAPVVLTEADSMADLAGAPRPDHPSDGAEDDSE